MCSFHYTKILSHKLWTVVDSVIKTEKLDKKLLTTKSLSTVPCKRFWFQYLTIDGIMDSF